MKKILGIEFGSTRIKAVLVDEKAKVLASGSFEWENRLLPGNVWSYRLEDAVKGMQTAFAELKKSYRKSTGKKLDSLDAFGISGMMHGYLPLDAQGRQLADFRTWRCTLTAEASEKLTKAFDFTIPQRWSIAHLYQRILDGGKEVGKIAFLTTLAGWVHFKLTGEKVAGLGEASGMFPVDPATKDYDAKMLKKFDRLASKKAKLPWKLAQILPRALPAGASAGTLTADGAKLLDPTGELAAGAVAAPPEGDVQTGMAATNTVRPGTANISAGTSAFAVVCLDKPLAKRHPEIDVCVSSTGSQVAMSHANTCTSDINAWVSILGGDYDKLFLESLKGAPDCGGVVTVPFIGGEPVVHMDEGRPLVTRAPDADFTLANFMRANIYSAFATVRLGLDILFAEGLKLKGITGHGGIFKSKGVAQQYLADALCAPATCLSTAGEGGAWGMALLAAYAEAASGAKSKGVGKLEDYLDKSVFKGAKGSTLKPTKEGMKGYAKYLENFKKALAADAALVR